MALVSIREYARMRGISHVAVLKRVKSGKITLVDGKVDPDAADRQWAENRDEVQFQRGATASQKSAESEKREGTSYSDLQRAEKALKIKREQLRLRKEEGELIAVKSLQESLSNLLVRTITRLEAIPSNLAPIVAHETDQATCESLIRDAILEARAEIAEFRINA